MNHGLERIAAASVVAVLMAVGTSCGRGGEGEPVGIRVKFLDGEGGALPMGVTRIEIQVTAYESTWDQCTPQFPPPAMGTFDVASLTDVDGNGRTEAVISDLPYGCPLYAEIRGYEGEVLRYSGRADGLVIVEEGRRRFVDVTLTQEDSVTLLGTTLEEPAFALTATPLDETDGRVLLTGGFVSATEMTCPAPYAADDLCLVVTASNRAQVFDQGSASVVTTRGALLGPRALHEATKLADGRVLVTGGVDRAMLILRNDSLETSWSGWEIADITPYPGDGYAGALNTWEVFDPEANPEAEDTDRDGDLERGGFLGRSDSPGMPGTLTSARFGHAASLLVHEGAGGIPSIDRRRVLITGGFGVSGMADVLSPGSTDVFWLDATGQTWGTVTSISYPPTQARRVAPASAMLGRTAWVFGGSPYPGDEGLAFGNQSIVEAWRLQGDSGDEWNVSVVNFSDFATTEHPEYVRMFGEAVPIGPGESTVLMSGWYGARCVDASGSPASTFDYTDGAEPPSPVPTYVCPPPDVLYIETLDYTLAVDQTPPVITRASPTTVPHALAEVLRLETSPRTGQVLVIGGITNLQFQTTGTMDLYDGTFAEGAAQVDAAFPASHGLNVPRAWHVAAETPGGNVVVAGGLTFDLTTRQVVVLDSVEFLNFSG